MRAHVYAIWLAETGLSLGQSLRDILEVNGDDPTLALLGSVDDDIEVSNLEAVMWAVLTRSDPATSIDIIHNAWSTPLDPRIEPERKAKGDFTNSRAIINACRPWHWRDKFPKVNAPSPEAARLARQKFGYLLK